MEQENKTTQPENENNENVPMPDYKKLYEEKVVNANERIECLECDLETAHKRIAELEKELEDTKAKAESSSKYHLQYYRQAEILKKALKALMESNNMKLGDMYEVLLESNSIDLDSLLMNLSK
jgi:hypothetical protein